MEKGRVLIVDDDPLVCNVLLRHLAMAGYTCEAAHDGQAGLEKLTHASFDVALIDMMMPVMDGLELLASIHELKLETVPIVLTGYSEVDRAVRAMKLGAYDFIQKPAHSDVVVKAIDRAVRHSCVVRYGREMANLAAQWETIFDSTPDMIVILDGDHRIVRYNRATAQKLQTTKEGLVGRHGHEALCQDDHPLESCPFLLMSTQSRFFPIEYCQRKWGGYYEATIVPLRHRREEVWGWMHIFRDVTPQREATERMAQSESLLRAIIQASKDAIVVFDRNGRITEANPAAETMFGVAARDLYGESVERLFATEFEALFMQYRLSPDAAGAAASKSLIRAEGLHRGGDRFPVEISLSEGEANGEPFTVASIRDITDRVRAEEALRESEDRYRSLYADSRDAIMMLAPEMGFLGGNRAALAMFGCRDEAEFMRHAPAGLSPQYQPDGALSADKAERMMAVALEKGSHYFEWVHRRIDGREFPATILLSRLESGGRRILQATVRDTTEQKRAQEALLETEGKYRKLLNNLPIGAFRADERHLLMGNPVLARMFGYASLEDMVGLDTSVFFDDPRHRDVLLGRLIKQGYLACEEALMKRRDGSSFRGLLTAGLIMGDEEGEMLIDGSLEDITEQKHLEAQLRHAQKMESIGQLAAGIAHEINTPTQYVGDNTRFLSDSFNDLLLLLARFRAFLSDAEAGTVDVNRVSELREAAEGCELDYLTTEIPRAISESLEGIDRVSGIVRAMKDFSHPGGDEKTSVDINKAIESTLTVARNEYKYVADLVVELDPSLPLVPCLPGDFNQVILNLVINAAHAIGDVVKEQGGRGCITVSTRSDGDAAEIRIADTGGGIPEKIRHRIFEPFFTTKEVGKGTGQGLAISRSVVVDKHGGEISFETETGKGTTFIIRLPLECAVQPVETAPAA